MTGVLALVTLLVRDYDEAIAFFTTRLGFALIENTPLAENKRWVVVAPRSGGARLLLARAANPAQDLRIGAQTGGRVAFFLHVEDFDAEHARLSAAGVVFEEAARLEPYGKVAVFQDIYGNRWDLVGPG